MVEKNRKWKGKKFSSVVGKKQYRAGNSMLKTGAAVAPTATIVRPPCPVVEVDEKNAGKNFNRKIGYQRGVYRWDMVAIRV